MTAREHIMTATIALKAAEESATKAIRLRERQNRGEGAPGTREEMVIEDTRFEKGIAIAQTHAQIALAMFADPADRYAG